jgi:6-phosphofructokinase 2
MIVTLTLNPALDKSTEMEKLVPEKKMRCAPLKIEAGGGGINVSKAIQELGGQSLAIFPSGGRNGSVLEEILGKEQVEFRTIPVAGETRENFVATETSTNKQYRYVMPGCSLERKDLDAVIKILDGQPVSFLIVSGSLPPGVPPDFLGELAGWCQSKGAKYIVDTSGEPLKRALERGVYLLKPNLSELCSLVGKDFLQLSEIDDAAREVLLRSRSEAVVVSMGPSGAMLVTRDLRKRFSAPEVKKLSTVGAGDSMVAGIAWSLASGKSIEDAVRFGIACGTAATMNKGTQLFNRQDVNRLYTWMMENH